MHLSSNSVALTPSRTTLTAQQIAAQHDRCCRALVDAGLNPFLTRFFKTLNGLEERFICRTYSHDNSGANFSFRRSRNWNSLPRVDAKKAKDIETWLTRTLEKEPGTWMGVVTLKAKPCTVDQVGQRRRKLMRSFRQFMVQQKRHNGVDHFFSSVHEPVRDSETGVLRINAQGHLLYHINLHFFFLPARTRKKLDRFIARLNKNFGYSWISKVENPIGAIKYLTAVQDRTDLLNHGEFVDWHKQTLGAPRFRCYGDRRPPTRRRLRTGESKTTFKRVPAMGVENQFILKTFVGKKSCTIWDNVTKPTDKLYVEQEIPREPDQP